MSRLEGKVAVVTGAGSGIGLATVRRLAADGAKVVCVDVDDASGEAAANEIGGLYVRADVTDEAAVGAMFAAAVDAYGGIDISFHNAGISPTNDDSILDTPLDVWQRVQDVNLTSVYLCCRQVIPHMLERGGGYLLQTVSAAGLLTHPQSATYAVTKHASLAFAEWLSMTYGDRAIIVSALCPQGVKTDMLRRAEAEGTRRSFLLDSALEPEQVADEVVQGLAAERFLILPHPEVAEYFHRKSTDYDRWIRGMRKLRSQNL